MTRSTPRSSVPAFFMLAACLLCVVVSAVSCVPTTKFNLNTHMSAKAHNNLSLLRSHITYLGTK